MIKRIDEILKNEFSFCLSNFHNCSVDNHDKRNPVYFINDTTPCYNFDKIKEQLCCDENVKSADSIFVSKSLNSIYLFEFKNKNLYAEKSLRGIGKKGSDSLFVLKKMCGGTLCFSENEIFVYSCIFSSFMADTETKFIIQAIKDSKLEEENLLDYNERVSQRVKIKIESDHPDIGFLYTRISVLLEEHFSAYIHSIK